MARRPAPAATRERGGRGGRGSAKSNVVTVNFKGVETFSRLEEGDHLMKVLEVTKEKGEKADYLAWKLESADGGLAYNNTSLSEKSLWNTKAWLEALGVEVPDDELDINLEDMVDLELMCQIEHETFEGKKKPRIVDFWPAEEDTGKGARKDRTEDRGGRGSRDKDEGKGGRSERGGRNAKPKDDKPPTEEEINDMDEDALADVIKEFDLDVDLDKFRTLSKKQAAVNDAFGE